MTTASDSDRAVRLLHLEDDPCDAEFIQELLGRNGLACEVLHVQNGQAFEAALAQEPFPFDLILCDYNIPGYDGLAALKRAKQQRPATPVIMVSGALDEEKAVECLHLGASDYLLKQRLGRLPSAVRRSLDEADRQRELARAAEQLRASEERFRQLAENSRDLFWFVSLNPERIEFVSPAAEEIWGLPVDRFYEEPQAWLRAIHPEDRERVHQAWEELVAGQADNFVEEYRVVRPDGSERRVVDSATPICNAAGEVCRVSGVARDVTEERRLEQQFFQAQKLEGIGQLAGGVAHDFNNLLSAVIGYSDLVLQTLPGGDPVRTDVEQIRRAGERASVLTRQLLAFSRRQVLQPEVLNLARLVEETEKLFRRLIGENIALSVVCAEDLGCVKADPGQMDQVIMNLVVNARDAMPNGGKLSIELQNVELDEAYARKDLVLNKGPYVLLAVSDTGVGMDEATLARIFEPFFTTKELGKGTGLGLATVYGIVRQSGGHVHVYSEPGQGTTFKVYLPRVNEQGRREKLVSVRPVPSRGAETVLLAEDDAAILKLARRILTEAGYTVLTAAHGEEALSLAEHHAGRIDLLLADVVLPCMNGEQLARRLTEKRPELKVLFMSGYMDDAIARHGVLNPGVAFLSKPLTPGQLTRKVREVLDGTGLEVGFSTPGS